jgi:dephospho-CoA kinase
MSLQSAKRPSLPVVGITGAVGTGKSQVAALFQRWGGVLISGDEVGKDVVDRSARLRRQLADAFGHDVIGRTGLKRALLARRAFASAEATLQLDKVVHPHLLKELNARVSKARRSREHRAVVIDAALLAEWGPKQVYWDCLIGVWAPMAVRRLRLRQRGWSDSEITQRARRQMSWTKRRAMVDFVVKNDGDLTQLERRARFYWQKILSSGCGGID